MSVSDIYIVCMMLVSSLLESLHKHEVPVSVQLFCSSTVLLRTALRFFHLSSKDTEIRMKNTDRNKALIKACPSLFDYNPRYRMIC